jgi:hypothetical protein
VDITDEAYKEGGKSAENAAILKVSSHFVFFKNYKKWENKAGKIVKKLDLSTITDKDILWILKTT